MHAHTLAGEARVGSVARAAFSSSSVCVEVLTFGSLSLMIT
jgi:hypothetical protein